MTACVDCFAVALFQRCYLQVVPVVCLDNVGGRRFALRREKRELTRRMRTLPETTSGTGSRTLVSKQQDSSTERYVQKAGVGEACVVTGTTF